MNGRPPLKVTTGGRGVVNHAGARLLADLGDATGLTDALSVAMAPTKQRRRGCDRGEVLADLAVMIADGGETISDLAVLRDQPALLGEVASYATAWRTLDAVDDMALERIKTARAEARAAAWAAGADPGAYVIDIDATLVGSQSDKERAAPTYKRGFGFHPLCSYLDACRDRHVRFMVGHPLTVEIARVLVGLPEAAWQPAITADGSDYRDEAEVAEITDRVDLSGWPEGTRMIARRENPHPGAQLTFTDIDGHRYQDCITDLADDDIAYLEALYRGRGRAERRICDAKDTGLSNLPSASFAINQAWVELTLIACDLLAWPRLLTGGHQHFPPTRTTRTNDSALATRVPTTPAHPPRHHSRHARPAHRPPSRLPNSLG